jgi:hypothetical protein
MKMTILDFQFDSCKKTEKLKKTTKLRIYFKIKIFVQFWGELTTFEESFRTLYIQLRP